MCVAAAADAADDGLLGLLSITTATHTHRIKVRHYGRTGISRGYTR